MPGAIDHQNVPTLVRTCALCLPVLARLQIIAWQLPVARSAGLCHAPSSLLAQRAASRRVAMLSPFAGCACRVFARRGDSRCRFVPSACHACMCFFQPYRHRVCCGCHRATRSRRPAHGGWTSRCYARLHVCTPRLVVLCGAGDLMVKAARRPSPRLLGTTSILLGASTCRGDRILCASPLQPQPSPSGAASRSSHPAPHAALLVAVAQHIVAAVRANEYVGLT